MKTFSFLKELVKSLPEKFQVRLYSSIGVGMHTPNVVLFVSGPAVSTVSAGPFHFIGMCAHAEWHPDMHARCCAWFHVFTLSAEQRRTQPRTPEQLLTSPSREERDSLSCCPYVSTYR